MQYKAKKSLGQNFLKSEPALRKIIEAGEIKKDDVILEIGPGKGKLTKQLLGSRCKVLAVEKDKELYELLKEKFAKEIENHSLVLIHDDILDFRVESYKVKSYKVIANIPYNITGAILKKFLTAEHQPTSMVLMVQNEVAKRIIGSPRHGGAGTKESILSISVKAYGEPKMIMKVPSRYFSPAPKVDSAVIAIKNISRRFFTENGINPVKGREGSQRASTSNGINEEKFWEIVRMGFAHKRKKLSGNLKALKLGNFASKEDLIGDKRAENLTLADWIILVKG